jgi:hypothetical protein
MRAIMKEPKHTTSTTPARQPSTPRFCRDRAFAALFRNEVEAVVGYWLDGNNWSFERWDLVPGTLLVNRRNKTIRFGVRAVGPDAPNPFEVIIRDTAKGWVFKSDCWEEADTEYPLRVFESPHSILFVFSGKLDHGYFHVEKAR